LVDDPVDPAKPNKTVLGAVAPMGWLSITVTGAVPAPN
jgi:hypothetical protein